MKAKKVMTACLAAAVGMSMLTGCGSSGKSSLKHFAKCAEVTDYEGIEYVPTSREVTQEDIDEAITSFCEDNNVETTDYESSIKDGDDVNINYVETISGTEYASNTDDSGTQMIIGKDAIAPGLDDQLIGLTPGTETTVTITYPDDYDDTTLAGVEAEFDVTINYILITTTPEYTDDLVNTATDGEYTTTDEYTQYLTDDLQATADENADDTDRANVLAAIRDETTFTQYPEQEVKDYITSMTDSIENSASEYGIGVNYLMQYFYGYSDEASFVEYLQSATESIMQEKIIVSSIALEQDLVASDAEIKAYKQELMDDNGVDEDTIDEQYSESELLFYATEEKVLYYLMSKAVQVESTEETTEDSSESSDSESDDSESDDSESDSSEDSSEDTTDDSESDSSEDTSVDSETEAE